MTKKQLQLKIEISRSNRALLKIINSSPRRYNCLIDAEFRRNAINEGDAGYGAAAFEERIVLLE